LSEEPKECGAVWRGGQLYPTCQKPVGHDGDHRSGLFRWRDEAMDPPHYRCSRCLRVSHNPNDAQQRYCGACHKFEDER